MRYFKVIAMSVSGGIVGNKVYEQGRVLREDIFTEGVADEKVAEGILIEWDKKNNRAVETTTKKEPTGATVEVSAKDYDSYTVKELRAMCDEKNIDHSEASRKADIIALLK